MQDDLKPKFEQLKASLKAEMPVSEVASMIASAPPPPPGSNGSFLGLNGTTMIATAAATLLAGTALYFAAFSEPTEELANAQPTTTNELQAEKTASSTEGETAQPFSATTTENSPISDNGHAADSEAQDQQIRQARANLGQEARPETANAAGGSENRPAATIDQPTKAPEAAAPTARTTPAPSKRSAPRKAVPDAIVNNNGAMIEFLLSGSTSPQDIKDIEAYLNRQGASIQLTPKFERSALATIEVTTATHGITNLWNSGTSTSANRTFDVRNALEAVLAMRLDRNRLVQQMEFSMFYPKPGTAAAPADTSDNVIELTIKASDTKEHLEALEQEVRSYGIDANFHGKFRDGKMVEFSGQMQRKSSTQSLHSDGFDEINIRIERDDKGDIHGFEMICGDNSSGYLQPNDEDSSHQLFGAEDEELQEEVVKLHSELASILELQNQLEAQARELEHKGDLLDAERNQMEHQNDMLTSQNDALHSKIWELEERAYLLETEAEMAQAELEGDHERVRDIQLERQRYLREVAMEMAAESRDMAREARLHARDAAREARHAAREARMARKRSCE